MDSTADPMMPGVLSDRQIATLVEAGAISAALPLTSSQIQPASLDLRLGPRAYRVRASFLAGRTRTIADRLDEFGMHEIDLTTPAVLEKGCVYVVPLLERVTMPPGLTGAASAKSSIGRLDLLTRVITDQGTEFDRIPERYDGPLFVEICPRSFSVVAQQGQMLNQVIFRHGDTALDDAELAALHAVSPIVAGSDAPELTGGLGFSVGLRPASGTLVGFRAKPHTPLIDLARLGHYAPADFWEEVHSTDGHIVLDPGAFYILVSRESIAIPPTHAAEMAPYLALVGEFRVHYAGFFDPGFGWGPGGTGSRGVLEVRCHEAPFVLEHGQTVGRLIYERMSEVPQRLYGQQIASNYQGQGLKLSKHFRAP